MDTPSPSDPGPAPEPQIPAAPAAPDTVVAIKIFGLGTAGNAVLELLIAGGLPAAACVAVDARSLATSPAGEKVQLEGKPARSSSHAEEPDPAALEQQADRLKALCQGTEVVFLVAGLGGTAGTSVGPVVARVARECGALAIAFVTTPFECEGSRRQALAQQGLEGLKAAADAVICLPNQKAFKLLAEHTSVLESFRLTDELLADGVRGIWRLLRRRGLIEIPAGELCSLLRGRRTESAFAVAEASGATRSREVTDRLLAHPLLDGGRVLNESNAVLVNLVGGPDLTMTEVHRVMEDIKNKCGQAQIIMGAAIDEAFAERLSVTLVAARTSEPAGEGQPELPPSAEPRAQGPSEELDTQLLSQATTGRPSSRFVPPPPAMTPEKMEQIFRQGQGPGRVRARKPVAKMSQGQLPLEIISKGRFDKSEPTIYKGEDLDVPTYIRRGVSLN